MPHTATKQTDNDKAAWMITRVTGTGDKLALVDAAKLADYELAELVAAYDNDENTEQARSVLEHAAQRVTLQEKYKETASPSQTVVEKRDATLNEVRKQHQDGAISDEELAKAKLKVEADISAQTKKAKS